MKKPQVQQASESLLQSTFPVSTTFVVNPLTEYNALNTCNNDAFICWICFRSPCSADFTKDPYIYISCVAGLLSSLQKWFTKTFSSHGSEGACVQCFSLQLHALCSNSLSQACINIHQCIPHIYDCQIKSHQFCISVITHCSWNSTSICGKACLGVSFSTLHFGGQFFFCPFGQKVDRALSSCWSSCAPFIMCANMSAPAVCDILRYKSLKYFKRRPWDSFLVLIEDLALLRQYLSCSTASCFGIYIYMLRYYGIISIKPSALHAFFIGVFVVHLATLTRLRGGHTQNNWIKPVF